MSQGIVIGNFTAAIYKDGEQIFYFEYDEKTACKTEADALEAAELLKAFFEAKEAGKVARLVVEDKSEVYCSDNGHSCLIVGQCANGCKHAPQRPTYGVIEPNPHHEPERPKTQAIQIANARRERREAFKVAKLAALIYAHNCNEFDERRAVASAAKLLKYAEAIRSECNGNCGMNYCDENGCVDRKRIHTDIPSMP